MIFTFNEDGILLHKCYIFRDVRVVIGLSDAKRKIERTVIECWMRVSMQSA